MSVPFEGFRLYTLERHRLTLPKEIADLLPWYEVGEECEVLAMPSPHGGLVVLSPEARELRDRTLSQLDELPALTVDRVASPDFARALRNRVTWTVRIGRDRRLTLPADARDQGLVPSSPDARVAVAVVMGAIQIWSQRDLPAALRDLAAQRLPP